MRSLPQGPIADALSQYFEEMTGKQRTEPARHLIVPKADLTFQPKKWAQVVANCLAYGVDEPGLAEAIPGSLDCIMPSELSREAYQPENFKGLLRRDGFIEIADPNEYPDDHIIAVALGMNVFRNRPDFHVYRRDSNHFWSHKLGIGSSPVDTDASGGPIMDPQFMDRGSYDIFVGYWAIPEEGLLVRRQAITGPQVSPA